MRKYIQHKHFWNILKIFSNESMYNKNLELLSSNICPLCEKVSTITLPLPGLTRHNITIYGADKLGISIWNFYQYLSPDQNFCKLGGDIAGVLQGFDFDGVIWDEIWDRLLYSDCREPSHCDRGHSLGIHLTAAHTRDFWARACASFSSDTVPLSAARVWNSNRLSSSLHQRRLIWYSESHLCRCEDVNADSLAGNVYAINLSDSHSWAVTSWSGATMRIVRLSFLANDFTIGNHFYHHQALKPSETKYKRSRRGFVWIPKDGYGNVMGEGRYVMCSVWSGNEPLGMVRMPWRDAATIRTVKDQTFQANWQANKLVPSVRICLYQWASAATMGNFLNI